MQKKHNILSAVLILILLAASVFIYCIDDKAGPVITIPEKGFIYTEGDSMDELLVGVTANDSHDGDVSDTIIIESLIPLSNSSTAKVTYAAQDKESHITKKGFVIQYIATNVENKSKNQGVTPTQSPINAKNATISPAINSPMKKPKPVKENPVIKLDTSEVTLTRGSRFDLLSYVKNITDNKDNREFIYNRIHVEGYYNLKIPGTYILEYYVIDSDKNQSAPVYLKLIIT